MTTRFSFPGVEPLTEETLRHRHELTCDRLAAEQKRIAARAPIKREREEGRIAEDEHNRICDAKARQQATLDQMMADHEEACRPLESEIADLRRKQVDCRIAGTAENPEWASRRAEIEGQLRQRNCEHERKKKECQDLLADLEKERIEAARKSNWQQYDRDLFLLGRPELVAASRAAASGKQWAERRLRAIQERADEVARSGLTLCDSDRLYLIAELEASRQAVVETTEASERAYALARETD